MAFASGFLGGVEEVEELLVLKRRDHAFLVVLCGEQGYMCKGCGAGGEWRDLGGGSYGQLQDEWRHGEMWGEVRYTGRRHGEIGWSQEESQNGEQWG